MTLSIEGALESIPFLRVRELVRALGLDTRDLHALHIEPYGITAEMFARNADGKRYFVGNGDAGRVAMHRIVIPVTDRCPADCDSTLCIPAGKHIPA